MAKTWTLAEIRAQWRVYTGRLTASQVSDADIDDSINDYYVNFFPGDAKVDEFNVRFTQLLSATDDGIYPIAQSVDRLDDPITINGEQIVYYRDRELFFSQNGHDNRNDGYRFAYSTSNNVYTTKFEDEQYITEPGLVIGTSDTAKVKNVAFDYSINNYSYSKALAESALTGSAVPAGKYGAWSLKVDDEGTITVEAATNNAVGYLTPRLAIEGLTNSDSASAYMGYVTVTKSDGAFTPDTTLLDAANVTATFTDGRFESRSVPISALLYGQDLYVYPKPNDIYELSALQIAERPTALAADDEAVEDAKWGKAIAIGAANMFLFGDNDTETLESLMDLTRYLFEAIRSDEIKRLLGGEVERSY